MIDNIDFHRSPGFTQRHGGDMVKLRPIHIHGARIREAVGQATQTPGYSKTLPQTEGTGGGSFTNDLQTEIGMEG